MSYEISAMYPDGDGDMVRRTIIVPDTARITEAYDRLDGWRAVSHRPERDGDIAALAESLVSTYDITVLHVTWREDGQDRGWSLPVYEGQQWSVNRTYQTY